MMLQSETVQMRPWWLTRWPLRRSRALICMAAAGRGPFRGRRVYAARGSCGSVRVAVSLGTVDVPVGELLRRGRAQVAYLAHEVQLQPRQRVVGIEGDFLALQADHGQDALLLVAARHQLQSELELDVPRQHAAVDALHQGLVALAVPLGRGQAHV